jgi:uncharacterized protein (TIGR03067 family)
MMKRHALVAAVMLCSFGAVNGQEKNPLQGNWIVVQTERGGRKPPAEFLKTLKVVIKGDKLEMSDAKRGETGVFKLDPAKKPKEIDLVFSEGPQGNVKRTALGIYELDGETLKLAWRKDGGPRPTEFSSIPGERTSELLILKRAKDK